MVFGVGAVVACVLVVVVVAVKSAKEDWPPETQEPLSQPDVAVSSAPAGSDNVLRRKASTAAGNDDLFPPDVSPPVDHVHPVPAVAEIPETDPATRPSVMPSDSEIKKKRPAFVRAEDDGEDFSLLPTEEVVTRLAQTTDGIERMKAAKVLGDRELAGTLTLSKDQRETLDQHIQKTIEAADADNAGERVEAYDQIQRLWRLADDKLIDALGSPTIRVWEAAVKNLALMRNEEIVKRIIARVETSDDATFKKNAIFALGMMKEKRDSNVPDRHQLGDEESEAIAKKLIIPFLNQYKDREKDPVILQTIETAFKFLETPFDARPKTIVVE